MSLSSISPEKESGVVGNQCKEPTDGKEVPLKRLPRLRGQAGPGTTRPPLPKNPPKDLLQEYLEYQSPSQSQSVSCSKSKKLSKRRVRKAESCPAIRYTPLKDSKPYSIPRSAASVDDFGHARSCRTSEPCIRRWASEPLQADDTAQNLRFAVVLSQEYPPISPPREFYDSTGYTRFFVPMSIQDFANKTRRVSFSSSLTSASSTRERLRNT